jgi:hypothetical protein
LTDIKLTILVAGVIIDESENGRPRCLAHATTSLANHLLKSLHHSILHAEIRSLRTGNKLGNKRINPGSQCDQDTKTLRGTIAQSFARSVRQTTGKGTLELRQEGLDSQRDLLQELVESVENGTYIRN